MDDRNLPTLVTQARTGDEHAFGELVRRFQDMAYAYAYAILGDFQLAEDAAQEAFVEAYRCLPSLQIPVAFPSWLKRIVLKHCDRLIRRKRLQTAPLDDAAHVEAPTPGPEAIAESHELQGQVLRALGDLTAEQRTVTTLYYINGYPQNEIAAFLDVPPSTVKSRLHTSRQRLREGMMTMVREALHSSALPESFTKETLARAVEEAASLNRDHKFRDAEGLLRSILAKTPDAVTEVRASALRELNRTLMWGQYEDEVFDDRYDELVANARAILAATDAGSSTDDDEPVWQQLAETLLYIPRMAEAVEHIETWIARKGPTPERLGMLAWARGCSGDYAGAEAGWSGYVAALASDDASAPSEGRGKLPRTCLSLVDCFAAAAEARWVRACVQEGRWDELAATRGHIRGDAIATGRPGLLYHVSEVVLSALATTEDSMARQATRVWRWGRYDPWASLLTGDTEGALRVAREGVEVMGLAEGGSSLVIAATAAGVPTPPDVMALIEQDGPEALDPARCSVGTPSRGRQLLPATQERRWKHYGKR